MDFPTTIKQHRKAYNPSGLHQRFAESATGQERLPEELPELDPFDYLKMSVVVNELMSELDLKSLPVEIRLELRDRYAKRCGKCSTVLPLFCFPANNSTPDRLHTECRDCNSNQRGRWYSDNADEIRARYQEWYKDNAESERERTATNYHNPDGKYRLSNQLHQGYYRAVRAGNTADRITPEDLIQYWESIGIDPLVCYLTGETLTPLTRSLDHIVAIGKGGGHTVTNLAPSTAEANFKKNNVTPEEARERLARTNKESK